jgi:starvation-inducible DNA-binding protein
MGKSKQTGAPAINIGSGDKCRAAIAAGLSRLLADKAGDEPTADLLTQRLTVHEQTAWMPCSLPEP